jgi:hypothetical protein
VTRVRASTLARIAAARAAADSAYNAGKADAHARLAASRAAASRALMCAVAKKEQLAQAAAQRYGALLGAVWVWRMRLSSGAAALCASAATRLSAHWTRVRAAANRLTARFQGARVSAPAPALEPAALKSPPRAPAPAAPAQLWSPALMSPRGAAFNPSMIPLAAVSPLYVNVRRGGRAVESFTAPEEEAVAPAPGVEEPAVAAVEEPVAAVVEEVPVAVVEEPTAAAVEEEPTAAAVIEEPTAAAVEEEPTAAAVIEEPTAAAVEEEPTAAAVIEETVAAAVEEETAAAAEAPQPEQQEETTPGLPAALAWSIDFNAAPSPAPPAEAKPAAPARGGVAWSISLDDAGDAGADAAAPQLISKKQRKAVRKAASRGMAPGAGKAPPTPLSPY